MTSLSINTNINSLNAQAAGTKNNRNFDVALERLASGLRINSARDDAAGLAISTRMSAQIGGLDVAVRNANDGISLAQIADSALNNINNVLLQVRDLAVQATNDTLSDIDRINIKTEVELQLSEIDTVIAKTRFGGRAIFENTGQIGYSGDKGAIIDGLRGAWLEQSEVLIEQYYGLKGDGAELKIVLDDTPFAALAFVSGVVDTDGRVTNNELHIDASDFPANPPNGGNAPYYSDRIIAHEMVHAVMNRTIANASTPIWFKEGAAEFIHGADERLSTDITASDVNTVVGTLDNDDGNWTNSSAEYSGGYAAIRYLHDLIKSNGGEGLKEVMTFLSAETTNTLDEAIQDLQTRGLLAGTTITNLATFTDQFNDANGIGATYVNALVSDGKLSNSDTGAIGGADSDGLAVRDAESVIADAGSYSNDPLEGFREVWEQEADATSGGSNTYNFQIGAQATDSLELVITGLTFSGMGLSAENILNNNDELLTKIDIAMTAIDGVRADIGASQNRMLSSVSGLQNASNNISAARSRILDADFAVETASLTKAQILQQASNSVLVQANTSKQKILNLLSQ